MYALISRAAFDIVPVLYPRRTVTVQELLMHLLVLPSNFFQVQEYSIVSAREDSPLCLFMVQYIIINSIY